MLRYSPTHAGVKELETSNAIGGDAGGELAYGRARLDESVQLVGFAVRITRITDGDHLLDSEA